MSLADRIKDDMKVAMRERDKDRLGTIRLILAAIKQQEVDRRETLTDDDVLTILNKMTIWTIYARTRGSVLISPA